ncbi:chaplin [Streptomyces sp. NPDC002845]
MRRVTRNGVIAAAAASGAMALTVPAYADSTADGAAADSPGLISGNTVQLPVQVPVNVCGNTLNVVGLLNAAAGNTCAHADRGTEQHGGAEAPGSGGGAVAEGGGKGSPGLLSGNGVHLPVDLPVNVSGNSATVAGLGNAAIGNEATNTSGGIPDRPDRPGHPGEPAPKPPVPPKAEHPPAPNPEPHTAPPPTTPSLAHTGTDHTVPALAASLALVLGGAAMHRRSRSAVPR